MSVHTALPVGLAVGWTLVLRAGLPAAGLAAAGAGAFRLAQLLFAQQTVPFSGRRHTVMLPVLAEQALGEATFACQKLTYQLGGRVLAADDADQVLVEGVAEKVRTAGAC